MVRLACGLAGTKVISLFAGPAGLAYFGQFQSLMSLAHNFSNAGITNGVIKHVAEYSGQPEQLARVLRAASLITIVSTAAISVLLIVGSWPISRTIFHEESYGWPIRLLGALLIFASVSLSLAALLNGQGRALSYFATQAASSVIVLILIVALVPAFSLVGALIALSVAQVGVCLLTAALCWREPNVLRSNWLPAWDTEMIKRLMAYSAAALLTAVAVPGSQLVVRDIVISLASAESAGYWQASVRVSEALMITATSVLTSYYLPRLSAAKSDEISAHVKQFLSFVVPSFALVLLIIFLIRGWVIHVLFTDAFAPAERLFAVQFSGDLVRMSGWVFSTMLLARGRIRAVIASELVFGSTFVALATLFVPILDDLGGNVAYAGAALVALAANIAAFLYMRREGRRYTSR